MLEMKTQCEHCVSALEPTAAAYICSYECTFCPACSTQVLQHVCPNCQGELVLRPRRHPQEPNYAVA
jgi:hypothetical protein